MSDSEHPDGSQSSGEKPDRIGPYRVLGLLGEGGMAEVYLAEQTEPVKRLVALKILKAGMDSKQVVARFESERQALAVLDHPNIAKIFDGGIAENGRSYFVMEHVKGVTITDYCDDQRLNYEARIRLFIDVCAAVQHAHLKGLIHRDLKPSNILVGVVDGKPQPKIIDFGIAKATTGSLTEDALYTQIGQVIGTPQYMSPEQAGVTGLDVDSRTDIYSLGVVLYELLVGAAPLDLTAVGNHAIHVTLREKDPPKPSTRFTQLDDTQDEIARVRDTNPAELKRQLTGDLDWVAMKAIEKDRTRRYETVNALAVDCQRYLGHEPVLARPPNPRYLLRRFVRRNRLAVAAGAIASTAIIVGTTMATLGLLKARDSEQVALQEASRAEAEAGRAEQVNRFLRWTLQQADPVTSSNPRTTVDEMLDFAAEGLESGEILSDPLSEADARETIGLAFMHLGEYEKSSAQFEALIALREVAGTDDPEGLVNARKASAQLYRRLGRLAEAEAQYTEALETARETGLDSKPELMSDLYNDLGLLLRDAGRYDEAAQYLEQVIETERARPDLDHAGLATALNNLALAERGRSNNDQATLHFEASLTHARLAWGDDHVNVASLLESIAVLHTRSERFDEAEALLLESLGIRRKNYGESHPHIANSLSSLGLLYSDMGRNEEAETYLNEAVDQRLELLGENHASTARSLHGLARQYFLTERLEEAEDTVRRAIAIKERTPGELHPSTFQSADLLGNVLLRAERFEESETVLRTALDRVVDGNVEDKSVLTTLGRTLGRSLAGQQRYAEAEPFMLESYEYVAADLGPAHSRSITIAEQIVELYDHWGRDDAKREWETRLADSQVVE